MVTALLAGVIGVLLGIGICYFMDLCRKKEAAAQPQQGKLGAVGTALSAADSLLSAFGIKI